MSDNFGDAATGEQKVEETQSPADKLEGRQPEGTDVPGAENPDSTEVKQEVNPNTE